MSGGGSTLSSGNDVWVCCALMAITAAMSLAVYVRWWLPGPEAQVYIAIARNMAAGKGFQLNGQSIGLIPSGWPYVLAGLMKVSSLFAFLHLVPPVLMTVAVGFWYYALRHFATPRRAFLVLLLSSQFYWWHYASMALVSEGLFMALFAPALLLAVQIGEGRRAGWRGAVLLVLCAAFVCIRWAGLIAWLPIAASLVRGSLRPRLDKQWSLLVASGVVTVGSFAVNQYLVEVMLPQMAHVGAPANETVRQPNVTAMLPNIPGASYTVRIVRAGRWIASLFWMPLEVGVSSNAVSMIANLAGWVLIVAFMVCAVQGLRRGQWIWMAVAVHCGLLCIRWRAPVARYYLPVAPLLLLGVWYGMEQIRSAWGRLAWQRLCGVAMAGFFASIVLTGACLWATDLYVAHSDDYYARYHAGHGKGLLASAAYLKQRGLQANELSVAGEYVNLNRQRQSGIVRAVHVLTDRLIRTVPRKVCAGKPNKALIEWARKQGVKYYLYRPPVSPWRVWHFRMPWLQKMVTGQKEIPENPMFVLYELTGTEAVEVRLPETVERPRRVPGLE